ncbi:hypothetical protein QN239_02660 [Mycolicibacterium sp. Y3]
MIVGDLLPGDQSGWSAHRWWQVGFALIVMVPLAAGASHAVTAPHRRKAIDVIEHK